MLPYPAPENKVPQNKLANGTNKTQIELFPFIEIQR